MYELKFTVGSVREGRNLANHAIGLGWAAAWRATRS